MWQGKLHSHVFHTGLPRSNKYHRQHTGKLQ
nr:MAG TPA: hypothetical protein [Inoviridae sp.]